MQKQLSDRQQREKEYHDRLHQGDSSVKTHRSEGSAYNFYWKFINDVQGLNILDFGCGNGWLSILLAKSGAKVHGIDISAELINKAKNWAKKDGVSGSVTFQEMPGENLLFDDDYFDLILGSAILHHTDLETSLSGIRRVLKNNGRAVFIEPMNQNIVLKLWRAMTPWRRSPTERALTKEDLDLVREKFPGARFHFWNLTSILTEGALLITPQSRVIGAFNALLEKLDRLLLKVFPWLGKYCAVVVMELDKNQKSGA